MENKCCKLVWCTAHTCFSKVIFNQYICKWTISDTPHLTEHVCNVSKCVAVTLLLYSFNEWAFAVYPYCHLLISTHKLVCNHYILIFTCLVVHSRLPQLQYRSHCNLLFFIHYYSSMWAFLLILCFTFTHSWYLTVPLSKHSLLCSPTDQPLCPIWGLTAFLRYVPVKFSSPTQIPQL